MQYLYQNLVNLRKIAIENRLSDDTETYIDKCYRHYSKTYNMPLDHVYKTLVPEQVILIYMEDEMEEWTPEEVIKIREVLSTRDVPVVESNIVVASGDEVSDDEWIAQQEAIAKRDEEKNKRKQQEDVAKKTHEAIEELTQSFKNPNTEE